MALFYSTYFGIRNAPLISGENATPMTTTIEFLLISSNHETLTAVRNALKQFPAHLNFVPSPDLARDFLARRKTEGIFVDLGVFETQELIHWIRADKLNRPGVIFACLSNARGSTATLLTGADFLLHKPLTVDGVASFISSALGKMNRERRRHYRHPVNLPATLIIGGIEEQVRLTDLGEGGMAFQIAKPPALSMVIEFSFELIAGQQVTGRGAIAWANGTGRAGVKFQSLHGKGEEQLQEWLLNQQEVVAAPVVQRG